MFFKMTRFNTVASQVQTIKPLQVRREDRTKTVDQNYSQSIELARGDDDIKALFFPMALENMPLQWFDKLNPGSIKGWEDLQRAFCENYTGIITYPITHAELKGLKQKGGESLRDYYVLENYAPRYMTSLNKK
jgi:hypothetical protein